MKSLLVILLTCVTLTSNAGSKTEPVKDDAMKKVCITVFDAKQKKDVEKCRTVKTHKKYDGTAVPEKKKK